MNERVDVERYQQTLSKAIRCRTVSHQNDDETDWGEFEKLHQVFAEAYPLIHKTLKKEVVGRAGLIYTWEGTDPDLKPIALIGHQDVVPIPEETLGDWTYPPFDGTIADGCLWGRGAVDMKDHVVAVLESVETLLEDGYMPKRTVLLCFGCNEEVVDSKDPVAKQIVKVLQERGIRLESLIDEGGGVPRLRIPGVIQKDLAVVGIAEKGYSDFKLTVESPGGHSASPPAHSAVGILAKAITRVEENPFKAKMTPQIGMILDKLFESLAFPTSILGKGLDFLRPVLRPLLAAVPFTASMMHTTTSVTMTSGSPQANVLPQVATATLNARIEELLAQQEQTAPVAAVQEETFTPVSAGSSAELEAYRRAERAEREAKERAELVYYQANSVLTEATAKVDGIAADITDMADKVVSQLTQLQMAVSCSKQALQDAASIMNIIKPNK